MKKITFTILITLVFGLITLAQDTESYTALKVTGDNIPVIDGTIDAIWSNVEIVPLTKVPEIDGEVHPNITVPDPEPDDYYAEFGMLWNEDGMYFLFTVVDDIIVIYEDYDTGNDTPADKWWWDDNINILFSKDLVNSTFTQWEFAWQPGIDQEEKLTSNDWLNPMPDGMETEFVESAWYNDGDTWTLETFISWDAFLGSTYTAGGDIYLETRARDDDDDGVESNSWETMFQWSTVNYDIENTGEGLGTVTLSVEEVQAPSAISNVVAHFDQMGLYPNPSSGNSELHLALEDRGDVIVSVYDISGRFIKDIVFNNRPAADNSLPLNLEELSQGTYLLQVHSNNNSGVLKYVKQ